MPPGRKPLIIPNVSWKIQVPIDIAAEIDLINLDPVRGTPAYGKRSEFVFLWRDGPPAQQAPIDLMVEVRAVTADNRRGPPTQLRVAAAPGS